jgi:diguanylate cyclase (GGDEF)-like protein
MSNSLPPSLRFGLRIALPAVLILIGTVIAVLVSLNQMAGIVNQTENALTHRSAEAALDTVLRRLGQSHRDYAEWDDAVRNLYGTVDPLFVRETFDSATANQIFFDSAYVLDEDRRVVAAVRRGEDTRIPFEEAYSPAVLRLLDGLADNGRIYEVRTGFVQGVWGLAAVAVGPIVPSSLDFSSPPTRARYLVIAKAFDNTAAGLLAQEYLIDGLRVVSHSEETPDHLDIVDPDGKVLAALTWTPGRLGSAAHAEVGPGIYLMLGAIALVVAALLLFAMRGLDRIRQGEMHARHAADHDPLTGLPNRAAMLKRLEEAAGTLRSDGAGAWLIFLDLDGFTEVNDSYGHAIGDRLLRNVAAGLRSIVADRLVCRVGGDEFAILSNSSESVERATDVGRLLIRYFSQPFDIDGRLIFIGTSIGIAELGADEAPEEILRRADIAMYQAKEQGRNRIVAYEPAFDAEREERVAIAADLGRALRDGELELLYQPVYDAEQRSIVGAEALVRWMKNGREVVPARIFIPIAEETGLIDDLGAWALRHACRDARAWTGIYVAVNVSAAQLRNPNFEILVQRALAETGLQPSRLELEVTETYLISNPVQAGQSINAVRALGVQISLDDFGTGYSSIGYLRSFAFDKMKLDRSLIAGIATDQRAQRFLQATVALAESLGLNIVAEGVESEDEARLLKIAGCREFQGYYFAPPCPPGELTRMLDAQSERGGRSAFARI